MIHDMMIRIVGLSYVSFKPTIPFRLLFAIPTWIAMLLWYRLIAAKEDALNQDLEKELIVHQLTEQTEESEVEQLDRITVKDGSKIHLIKVDELIYIQACGDYVMLITPSGEYVKVQTMKYFETHLPPNTFVRVHRSTIYCERNTDLPSGAFWKGNISTLVEEWGETTRQSFRI